jgi:hypothetical protein
MPADLTETGFSEHLGTTFRVNFGESGDVDLKLVEVKGYPAQVEEHAGMERFSLIFTGALDHPLSQQTYRLRHEEMGEFDIFLVPIGRDDGGFRYEAIFNYFK